MGVDVIGRADAFLTRRRRYVIGTILALSVLLRLTYFLQLQDDACLYQYRWEMTDMSFNDTWAKEIASGGVLTNKPFHPLHNWHQELARKYLSEHPEKLQELLSSWHGPAPPPATEKLLWDQWYGGKTFHQEPLYPYLLALTYKLFGTDVRPMLILQLMAGVFGNLLVYLIARRYFGDFVGTVSGVMATLCGPSLYYEMTLLRDPLMAAAGLAFIYVAQRALDTDTWPGWLVAGLTAGVTLLLKSSILLEMLILLGALAWICRREPHKLAARACAFLGGVALLLAPVVVRNAAVGAPPFGLSSVGTITFVCANAADYGRDPYFFSGFFVSRQYAADIMGTTNGRFLPAAIATLATHDNVGSYIRQVWHKARAIFHWYEAPNNSNFYYYRLHASILRIMPVTFLLVGPLALVGLALAAPRIRQVWLLVALVLTKLVVLFGFGVFSRLRLQVVAPLIVFAALTLATTVRWISGRKLAKLSGLVAALILLTLWVGRPLPEQVPLIRLADYRVPVRTYYEPRAREAADRHDYAAIAALWADALRYEPDDVRVFDTAHDIQTVYQYQLANLFGQVHYRYWMALQSWNDHETDPRRKEWLVAEITRQQQRLEQLSASVLKKGQK